VEESVADAVDFFGHRLSKEQSSEQELTSHENTNSKEKKKSKHSNGDENTKKKRKRSMLEMTLFSHTRSFSDSKG
jgi:hypothetical protein